MEYFIVHMNHFMKHDIVNTLKESIMFILYYLTRDLQRIICQSVYQITITTRDIKSLEINKQLVVQA